MKKLYKRISQEKAKEMMEDLKEYIILDVRTKAEYESGHIKGAVNVPNEEIYDEEILDIDFDTPIFVIAEVDIEV